MTERYAREGKADCLPLWDQDRSHTGNCLWRSKGDAAFVVIYSHWVCQQSSNYYGVAVHYGTYQEYRGGKEPKRVDEKAAKGLRDGEGGMARAQRKWVITPIELLLPHSTRQHVRTSCLGPS